jgi:hypothetical protein
MNPYPTHLQKVEVTGQRDNREEHLWLVHFCTGGKRGYILDVLTDDQLFPEIEALVVLPTIRMRAKPFEIFKTYRGIAPGVTQNLVRSEEEPETDQPRPTHIQRLRSTVRTGTTDRRELHLVYWAEGVPEVEGQKKARIWDVVEGIDFPEKYSECSRLVNVEVATASYEAWLLYKEFSNLSI